MIGQPKRVLIVRSGNVGEIINTLPMTIALRTRFPRAEIAWLVEGDATPFLKGHWAIDRLLIVRKGWLRSLRGTTVLRRRLQAFAPNVAIDVDGTFKSGIAAWFSGAKVRVGFGGAPASFANRCFNNYRVTPETSHLVEQSLELLKPFGIVGSSIDFDLPEYDIDRRSVSNILHREGLHGDFVLVKVGGENEPHWSEERLAVVCRYLLDQWNLPTMLIWETEPELRRAEIVAANAKGAALVAPAMTLSELTTLCRRTTLFIGADTPLLQVAAAVTASCVALYGPTPSERNRPLNSMSRIVSDQRMSDIAVQNVCNTCDAILEQMMILAPDTLPGHFSQERREMKAA